MDWTQSLETLQTALSQAQDARAALELFETETAATIAKYARSAGGLELDVDAIKASVTRPYTVLPLNEHEAQLVQWRGVKMPGFGWLVKQEAAFNVFRVTRSMALIGDAPAWMQSELGWKRPDHAAILEGNRTTLRVTEGDEATFKRKYGAHLAGKMPDGTFKIKGGDAWIRLVAQLVKDGILPYSPQPVDAANWDARAELPIALRPYQERAVDEFHDKGAVLVNYPPGAGKTYITCAILNKFIGKVLILADTTILVEQWRDRVQTFAPKAQATISTYQGAQKYLDAEWDLIVFDEAQRLPATTFSKLAFVKTKYRLGLTGTPWREDDRQHLILALAGFPLAVRWSELVAAGILKRPRIIVATVASESAKTAYVKQLVAKRKGRAIIFCDWIEQGNALANALGVPFIHGETKNKLELLRESEVAVVSRIGDRGLDLPDLKLVIEVAGQGAAREQFAQRVGRLLHGAFAGEFHTVFTPDEAEKFRPRVFGVEAELAGEVDIEFVTVGDVKEPTERSVKVRPAPRAAKGKAAKLAASGARQPESEADALFANPAVAKILNDAETKAGVKARGYVRKALKLAWDSPVTLEELRLGRGLGTSGMIYFKAGFREAIAAGLAQDLGGGRYLADKGKIKKIAELSQRYK
jgi:superfamily II DNA or RNA helicase